MCQVVPLEVMIRGGRGWRGHWTWGTLRVCPPCQSATIDALGQLQLQEDDELELQLDPRAPDTRKLADG